MLIPGVFVCRLVLMQDGDTKLNVITPITMIMAKDPRPLP